MVLTRWVTILLTVTYSAHAEQKLLLRGLSQEDVEKVIEHPSEIYDDRENSATIAIGPLEGRTVVVVHRRMGADVKVITVYHTRKVEKLVSSKTGRGAWVRI